MVNKITGELIREMRKAAGMSLMRLAEKIGVTYQQVQKYEKGISNLSLPRLFQIAEAFNISAYEFIEMIEFRLRKEQEKILKEAA
jgi:transcriptional regulator with XRE-family HTH domain